MGSGAEAPRVGQVRTSRESEIRGVGVVRQRGAAGSRHREGGGGKRRHLADAGGVGVGREGVGVARSDRPTPDDTVHHAGGGVACAIHLRKGDEAGAGKADLAQGIGGGNAQRAPAGEEHGGLRTRRADEVADVHADRSARSGHWLRFENVRTPEQGDFVEGHDGVDRAGADDTDGSAQQRDGDRLSEAGRHGNVVRILAEVIPDQGAVVDIDRGRGRESAGVDEAQGAAADDRVSDVIGNVGERRGVVT